MASSAKKLELGRIVFPKNPWPKGHRITKIAWTGHLVPDSGLWFDLHLDTAAYDAEDKKRASDDDDDEDEDDDWRSRIVWENYERCTISSTKWGGSGFRAATARQPLDLAKLKGRTFLVDPVRKDRDFEKPAPFGIYLLGHDAAAAHRITFGKRTGPHEFDLTWSGRICLAYAGRTTFEYKFDAKIRHVSLGPITLPKGMSMADGRRWLSELMVDSEDVKLRRAPA